MARSKAVPNPSIDLSRVLSLHSRSEREQSGLFWAEGHRCLHSAVRAHREVSAIVYCPELLGSRVTWQKLNQLRNAGVATLEVSAEQFLALSSHKEPQGVGIVARQTWQPLIGLNPGSKDLWVVLDNVRTAGNLGTILRTCAAVGAQGVMLIGGEADPHDPACVRASMGAIFSQRLIRTSAKALAGWRKRHPCRIIGASPAARDHYRRANYKGPLLLLMGSERSGLRERQQALCDQLVSLPMVGDVDSLNLAIATGVLLYEAVEQRMRL